MNWEPEKPRFPSPSSSSSSQLSPEEERPAANSAEG